METVLKAVQKMGAPPIFSRQVMEQLAEPPSMPQKATFADPTFTRSRKDRHGRKLPQAIAHRGYKAKFPENTMSAFKGAVAAGVDAVETDVHLTSDGVVVLSHDATLSRCFGVDKKLLDCDWKYLKDMRTIKEPHESLTRLEDLLQYLAQPEVSNIWVLLDIKMTNNPQAILCRMSEAIARVPPAKGRPWESRILLGCWAAKFVPFCHQYLPGFPITNIGFSVPYSRQFLAIPNCSFNMLQAALVSPAGRKFIRDVQRDNRAIYSWTVNDTVGMDWCIRKQLDGVITDDPSEYLEYRDSFDAAAPKLAWDWAAVITFIRINIFAWIFTMLYWRRFGFNLDKRFTTPLSKD